MRQINALLTQLDAKKRDHFEFVAKELQELQDCGKLSEVFIFYLKLSLVSSLQLKFISLKRVT
jgi:hypothetical protein